MEPIDFLFQLAVILLATKSCGIIMRKLGLPQVLGFIIAGILIGPAIWSQFFNLDGLIFPLNSNSTLNSFAEVGVILVLFAAGLETDLSEIKRMGVAAFLVAMGGVLVPLALGFGIGCAFLGTENLLSCLFIGVIITATSVGITVETLHEMGKLKGKIGMTILSAAIIDDVIGIVILTIVMSLQSGAVGSSPVTNLINPNGYAYITIPWMMLFFVFAIGAGFLISKGFKAIEKRHPNTHRVPILSLVVCFAYAYIAERVFGVADITGAYFAGVILSTNHKSAEYTDKKISVNSYTIFGPIFFANIGIKISFDYFTLDVLWFALAFVAVAIIGKIIGCGGVAKLFKFSWRDSFKVGVGMIARGEVALIVAQKGIDAGLLDQKYLALVILLVLVSSILAPILLKIIYKKDPPDMLPTPNAPTETPMTSPVTVAIATANAESCAMQKSNDSCTMTKNPPQSK